MTRPGAYACRVTTSADLLDLVGRQTYVSLTTYRRTGEGVATPVWIARDGDELVVVSVDGVGKTKRLARNADVALRPCDIRGSVAPDAPTWTGTARVVRDEAGVAAVRRVIAAKYLMARVGNAIEKASRGAVRRKPRAGIRITLTQP